MAARSNNPKMSVDIATVLKNISDKVDATHGMASELVTMVKGPMNFPEDGLAAKVKRIEVIHGQRLQALETQQSEVHGGWATVKNLGSAIVGGIAAAAAVFGMTKFGH